MWRPLPSSGELARWANQHMNTPPTVAPANDGFTVATNSDGTLPTPSQPQRCYPITEQAEKDLEKRFRYHSPKADQIPRYADLRAKARELAFLIATSTPASREQSLAFTKLEECVMHANSAIARNE